MPRGEAAKVGDTFVNRNGYTYVKTEDRGFVAKHVLVKEKDIGRRLASNEFVKFRDNDRSNCEPDNLELRIRGDRRSPQARLAALEARIEELEAEAEELRQKIASDA